MRYNGMLGGQSGMILLEEMHIKTRVSSNILTDQDVGACLLLYIVRRTQTVRGPGVHS